MVEDTIKEDTNSQIIEKFHRFSTIESHGTLKKALTLFVRDFYRSLQISMAFNKSESCGELLEKHRIA